MKKSAIKNILITISILLLFTGCIGTDSDGDGYDNDVDAFPNNPNLSEKLVLMDAQLTLFGANGDFYNRELQTEDNPWVIEDTAKYLFFKCEFKSTIGGVLTKVNISLEDNQNISLTIRNPSGIMRYEYEDFQLNDTIKIEINSGNVGDWYFNFSCINLDYDVWIKYDIYLGR